MASFAGNFTFESFDVTSQFSALRPTYSWLPKGIYSHTEITPMHGQDFRSITTLFVLWLMKGKIVVYERVTRPPLAPLGFSRWSPSALSLIDSPAVSIYFISKVAIVSTVNSLYSRHCRELELVSSLACVHNSGSLFHSNIYNLFLPGI